MGVADQLTQAATTYNPVPSGPGAIPRDGDFDSTSEFRDARPDRVQVLTFDDVPDTGKKAKIYYALADGTRGKTAFFVQGTNLTAAAIQTALRSATGDTALTVTGTTDTGPFTVTHTKATFARAFPKYTVTDNDDATTAGSFAASVEAGEGDATIGALGESHRVSETNTILKPTIGTVTVTAGTDEVQSLTYSAGTDGGTFALRVARAGSTVDLDFDASVLEVQTALDEVAGEDYAPTASIQSGAAVATLDLDDIGAGDTYKLTYDSVATAGTYGGVVAGVNTYGATDTTDIQSMVDELLGANEAVVARVDNNTYTITKLRSGAFASTFTATSAVGFTPLGSGGYTAGGKITTAAGDLVWYFTFESAFTAGRPIDGTHGFGLGATTALTDGGVTEAPTLAVVTPGVLGSASSTYTENGGGSDVLGAAVNDDTGVSYGFQKDAASPIVTGSLPAGTYHLILRTVESGRVSKADTKAFTVTST